MGLAEALARDVSERTRTRGNRYFLGGAVRAPATPERLKREVDDDRRDADGDEAARGGSPTRASGDGGEDRRRPDRQPRVVGGAGEVGHRAVERGRRRPGNRRVDGDVDALGVAKPGGLAQRWLGFGAGGAQREVIL